MPPASAAEGGDQKLAAVVDLLKALDARLRARETAGPDVGAGSEGPAARQAAPEEGEATPVNALPRQLVGAAQEGNSDPAPPLPAATFAALVPAAPASLDASASVDAPASLIAVLDAPSNVEDVGYGKGNGL